MAIHDIKEIICLICGDRVMKAAYAKVEVCGDACKQKYYKNRRVLEKV